MTKQSEDNKPLEENTKTQKKHGTRKRNKKPKFIQKDFFTVSLVSSPQANEHKYFISGGIMIDFKLLKCNWIGEDQFFNLKGFNHIQQVQFANANGFFEVSIESNVPQISDFSFIVQMLDSLGDQKAHETAIALKKYLQAIQDLKRKNQQDKNYYIKGKQSAQSLLELAQPDPVLQIGKQETNDWNFEKSRQKVSEIMQRENVRKDAQFYFVIKATEDYCALSNYGVSEVALRIVLGQVDQAELIRVLLENGILFVDPCINSFLEIKAQELDNYLQNPGSLEPECVTVKRQLRHITLNNYFFDLEFTFQRYRLSNYLDRMNDFLIVAKLDAVQQQLLMNQLFLQKLNCFMGPGKSLLQDFRYQAQSEYFIEKFYPSKLSQTPTTQPTNTIINSSNMKTSSQSLTSPSSSSP